MEPVILSGNPLMSEKIYASYATDPNNPDADWKNHQFTREDLIQVMPKEGRFVFKQGDIELTLVRVADKSFNWMAF